MLIVASSPALNTNMHFKISIIRYKDSVMRYVVARPCHTHRKCINRYLNSKMTIEHKQ